MGCPDLPQGEVERLTPIYLETLPAAARNTMREQLEKAPPEARSRLIAIGMYPDGVYGRWKAALVRCAVNRHRGQIAATKVIEISYRLQDAAPVRSAHRRSARRS